MRRPDFSFLSRVERSMLLAAGVAIVALWLFAELVDEVGEGDSHAFDEWLLLAFRQPGAPDQPVGPWWLQVAVSDMTSLGSISVLSWVTAGALGFLLMRRQWGRALFLLVSVSAGMALSSLLKLGIDRPRPDLVAPLAEVHTLSFPSGHAMLSAVTYLTLGILVASSLTSRPARLYVLAAAILTALAVGVSRVFLGVHWPTDVIAGWAAGAAWALLCWLVLRLLEGGLVRPPSG